MTTFSLAHLTVLSLPPAEVVRVAARTGYQTVGLRLIQVTDATPGHPLMDDPAALRATKAAIRDTGVGVMDIEFVQLRPDTEPRDLLPFLQVGGELGAKWVVAAPYDPDLGRLADRFAALCDLAAPFGLGVVLEFFPWTVVSGVSDANALLASAGRPNAGVLVDALHFDRGPSTLADLRHVPASRLPFVHLCDAPVAPSWTQDQLLHAARVERLPPGEGQIDLRAILQHLPADIPVAVEVPMAAMTREAGPEAVARRVYQAAARLLSSLEPRPQ